MVIGDLFSVHQKIRSPQAPSELPLYASVVARISSFSIDLIFLLPLLNLVFVPFQRRGQAAAFLDQNTLATFYLAAGMLTLMATYILATTLISQFGSATLGQRLLGLRVNSVSGQKPSVVTILIRQAGLFFSLGLACLPLMSALYNKDHRTWIDRLTNTYVESSSAKFAARWSESAALWAKFCSLLIVSGTLAFGLSVMAHQYRKALDVGGTNGTQGCQSLKAVDVNERLSEGLTLYATGEIDESCLDQEANWALAREGSLPLIYLAKSFSRSKSELSDKYLRRVCQEIGVEGPLYENRACRFSQLIQNWNSWLEGESSEGRVQTLLDIGADYALVWGARQFFSKAWWSDTLRLLEPLSQKVAIAEFVQIHKMQSLWALGEQRKVREIFSQSAGLWGQGSRRIVAQSLCEKDLERQDCAAAETPGCQFYLLGSQQRDHLDKKDSALALQILSCPSQITLALSSQWQDKLHEELIPLWKAVKHLHQGDLQKARLLLSGSSTESASPASLKFPAHELQRSPSSNSEEAP